jgi:hypothetical protein
MEAQQTIYDLFEKAGGYLETKVDLLKLQAVNKSSKVISSLVSRMVIIMIVFLFILTLSLGLSFWIGEALGKVYYGFFIVAGFYALTGLLIYLFRNTWLKKPVGDTLIKQMLN